MPYRKQAPRAPRRARKLTENRVVSLRRLARHGLPTGWLSRFATMWGVSYEACYFAVTGRTWKHIRDPRPVRRLGR